jgi:hypothetical protein
MKNWKSSDIGKVIIYKEKTGVNNKVVIYNVNKKVPNTICFVEYPITLNSEIYPPILTSKLGIVGIVKSQKKENDKYLENAGDWCFIDRVSNDEMRELERIANSPKISSYGDLSPENIFKS